MVVLSMDCASNPDSITDQVNAFASFYVPVFQSMEAHMKDRRMVEIFEVVSSGCFIINGTACIGDELRFRPEKMETTASRIINSGFVPMPLSDEMLNSIASRNSDTTKEGTAISVPFKNIFASAWRGHYASYAGSWTCEP